MADKVSKDLNGIAVANKLFPYRHLETLKTYITIDLKDDSGKVVGKEDMLVDSDAGQLAVLRVATELLGKQPTVEDIRYGTTAIKSVARAKVPRAPTNPVAEEAGPKASGVVQGPNVQAEAEAVLLPPENIKFVLTGSGEVMAQLEDGRLYKTKHDVVKSLIYEHLWEKLGRCPKSWELDGCLERCIARAKKPDGIPAEAEEERLEQEPLILAIVALMILRHNQNLGPFVGSQSTLRKLLKKIGEDNDLDIGDLPAEKNFRDYLLLWREKLKEHNISLSFKRTGLCREYTIGWIDETEIPDWNVLVTADDGKKGGDPSQKKGKDEDDIFKELGISFTQPETPPEQPKSEGPVESSAPAEKTKASKKAPKKGPSKTESIPVTVSEAALERVAGAGEEPRRTDQTEGATEKEQVEARS